MHPLEKDGPTSQLRKAPGKWGTPLPPGERGGEGRWEGISRDVLTHPPAFPFPEDPHLF